MDEAGEGNRWRAAGRALRRRRPDLFAAIVLLVEEAVADDAERRALAAQIDEVYFSS